MGGNRPEGPGDLSRGGFLDKPRAPGGPGWVGSLALHGHAFLYVVLWWDPAMNALPRWAAVWVSNRRDWVDGLLACPAAAEGRAYPWFGFACPGLVFLGSWLGLRIGTEMTVS